MKTYTLTPAAQEAFTEFYNSNNSPIIGLSGFTNCLEAFFQAHPEHLTEQPSTSKRDEVARMATAIFCSQRKIEYDIAVIHAINLQAEVDKRFNTTNP